MIFQDLPIRVNNFRESIQTKSSSSDEMRTVGEYCDGSGFMMTSQVGRSIVREAEITKSYSDENLYITGILRNDEIIDRLIIWSLEFLVYSVISSLKGKKESLN